jgi:hypothetical protein
MKSAANPRDVPYQRLIKVWLQGNLQDSQFLSAPFAIYRRHPQVHENNRLVATPYIWLLAPKQDVWTEVLAAKRFPQFRRQERPSIDLRVDKKTLQITTSQAVRIAGLRDSGWSLPSAQMLSSYVRGRTDASARRQVWWSAYCGLPVSTDSRSKQ